MQKNTNRRSARDNPYMFDEMAVGVHRSKAGMLWRWRVEITATVVAVAGYLWLAHTITTVWTLVALGGAGVGVAAVPSVRRFVAGHAWCVITRHRLQRVCFEGRLHTRAGRLPLILWIRPTKVGERAHILCRAGVCAADFEDYTEQIAAACFAREARITAHKKWSHLVAIDIVRHDTLAAKQAIPSPLLRKTIPTDRKEAA